MAIFGIILKNDNLVNLFVKKMQNKLKSPDMFQNPFVGFIKSIKEKDETFLLLYLDLVWINPINIAIILTISLFIAKGFNFHWVQLLTFPLWMGAFMFTTTFSKLAIRFSLRKFGYKEKIRMLSQKELLLRLANWEKKSL